MSSIAALLLVTLFVLPQFGPQDICKTQKEIVDIAQLTTAIEVFHIDNGFYPKTLAVLAHEYIRQVPEDRWGRNYVYHFPPTLTNGKYDLGTYGKDGQQGGSGDNEDYFANLRVH